MRILDAMVARDRAEAERDAARKFAEDTLIATGGCFCDLPWCPDADCVCYECAPKFHKKNMELEIKRRLDTPPTTCFDCEAWRTRVIYLQGELSKLVRRIREQVRGQED